MTNDPDSGINKVDYNGFGDVVDRTPADGVVTTFMHDALGRTIQERVSIPRAPDDITTYVWDEALNGRGKIASSTSPDGVVREFGYDDAGRPNATNWTVDGSTFQMRYFYDGLGRPSGVQYPRAPGHASFTVNTSYNAFGYVQSVSRNGKPFWTTTLMTVDDLPTIGTYGDGTSALRIYDAATGLLTNRIDTGVASAFSNSYDYDASGRVTSQEELGTKRKETFGYDELDRLASWTLDIAGKTNRAEAYLYDDIGNLTTVASATGRGGVSRYEYGQNGAGPHALTSVRQGAVLYDARGRATTELGRTIAYSEFNLPTSIQPIGATAQQATTFQYDAEHHRVLKSVPGPFGTAAKTITLGELYERHQVGGQTTDVYHVYGPDGLVAQVSVDEKTQNETLEYVHGDRLGSVAALTSASHAPIFSYYQPFGRRSTVSGNATSTTGSDVDLGFQGLLHDDDLELIDQRGRVYDPVIRRFLTPDAHIDQPRNSQSLNTYSFVMNDPVNHTDPSGFGNPDPNGPDCPGCADWSNPGLFGFHISFDFGGGGNVANLSWASSAPIGSFTNRAQSIPWSSPGPSMPARIERSVLAQSIFSTTLLPGAADGGPGDWDRFIQLEGGFVAGLGVGLTPYGALGVQSLTAFGVLDKGTRNAQVGRDIGEIVGGFITGIAGATGGAASLFASGTGIGALAGVPAFAISTAAVTGGFGNVLAAAKDLSTLRSDGEEGSGSNLKWGNAKSVPTYGHTFSEHGAQNTKGLIGEAGGTGQSQGQWIDNNAAAKFLAEQRPNMNGKTTVDIPSGLGRVIRPDGSFVPATRATIIPSANGGIRTAYPIE